MFGFRETFDIAAILTLILLCRFGCCFVRCFEEDEESCLPKRDEVLVVIENMIGGFKLVCDIYIYIYKRACCSSLMSEEKKVVFVSRSALFSAVKPFRRFF